MSDAARVVRYEVDDRVATITLSRPERMNAMTARMRLEIIDGFDTAEADDDVRAVIVTGDGDAFCAGADLGGGPATFDKRSTDGQIVPDGGGELVLRMFASTKPVIGAINGVAVGIGATMTLPMDVRLAADDARFGFVFTRRGLVPDGCSSWFLPRVVGLPTALDWMLSGRVFAADEALQRGLVSAVHPVGDLLTAAHAAALSLVEGTAPVSVALTRRMIWHLSGTDSPVEAQRVGSRAIRARAASEDLREGVASFTEKRTARFPDLVSRDLPDVFSDDGGAR